HADLSGNRSQLVDQCEIGLQILSLEARAHIAEVARAGARLRPVAADQTARQHTISGDADPQLAADGKYLLLDSARDQRVLDLQIADRVDGPCTADRIRTHFRQTHVTNVAGLHHVGDGANGVFDRHRWIKARGAIDVDVICSDAAQL